MTKASVRTIMAQSGLKLCHEKTKMDYFSNFNIQTEYEEDGTVSFIGVSSDIGIDLIYEGVDLFNVPAEEAFELISKAESDNHVFESHEYIFPDQIIALWNSDFQYDLKGGEQRSVWAQIGIGDPRYLCSINKIRGRDTQSSNRQPREQDGAGNRYRALR